MTDAIKAVQSGEMSQRGAAEKFQIPESTLRLRLSGMRSSAHPETSQSQPGDSSVDTVDTVDNACGTQARFKRNHALRKEAQGLCRAHGITSIDGKPISKIRSRKTLCDALLSAGVAVPSHLFLRNSTDDTQAQAQSQSQSSASSTATPSHCQQPASYALNPTDNIPTPGLSASFDFERPGATAAELDDQQYRAAIAESQDVEWRAAADALWKLKCLVRIKYNEPTDHCTWNWADWNWLAGEIKTTLSLVSQRAQEASAERFNGSCYSSGR